MQRGRDLKIPDDYRMCDTCLRILPPEMFEGAVRIVNCLSCRLKRMNQFDQNNIDKCALIGDTCCSQCAKAKKRIKSRYAQIHRVEKKYGKPNAPSSPEKDVDEGEKLG